ncbi:MAG: class I SAM-dependent methyltransferase [Cyanobacteria bacterium J007]|nr:MAG: class I SAM-dependent methyltransferase [Cyanobacteria bacterium J007]
MKQLDVLKNYAKAVAIGAYDSDSPGLFGKHDNVRRYWEDRFNRTVLSQFLEPLVERQREANSGIRVMDLGCGAGEGLGILTSLPKRPRNLDSEPERVLSYRDISCYKGVDISPAMIQKGKEVHAKHSQASFHVCDLNEGLPMEPGEAPYDVYFSSYGSLSHLNDESFEQLIGQICKNVEDRSIFVADLLGRYSYEWPCYWGENKDNGSIMKTYSMSYIYPPDARGEIEVERFPIRFWGGEEFDRFVTQIAASKGVKVAKRRLCDRSILVGRHMNTREFNPEAPPLRAAVNSLHQINTRTDLSQLLFEYHPHPDHPHLNRFFDKLQDSWNAVVYACMDALEHWRNPHKLQTEPPAGEPPLVQDAIRTIRKAVRCAPNMRLDDPRANLVEPQLAYLLRELEWNLQQGLGASHGLLAVYEFKK